MLKKIREFLTPGWVLTAVVAVAFSYIAFTVLAPWQLGKNTATQERNDQLRHAFEVPPVPAEDLMRPGTSLADGTEWRRVTAQGQFVPNTEVLLRNRPVDGAPAIQVLNVFHTTGGQNFVVNRGFVRPSGTEIPEIQAAPAGTVTISAYTRRNELTPVTDPIVEDRIQVYGIETGQIGELVGAQLDGTGSGELHPDWLQLDENSPGVIAAIPLPQLESGPYLSYGIQWIFFGVMAPAAVIWFVYAEVRERRRDREEQAAHEAELVAREHGGAAGGTGPSAASGTGAGSAGDNGDDAGAGAAAGAIAAADASAETTTADGGAAAVRNSGGKSAAASASTRPETQTTPTTAAQSAPTAEEIRAQRLAQRYGDSGHRIGGKSRDNRYDERF